MKKNIFISTLKRIPKDTAVLVKIERTQFPVVYYAIEGFTVKDGKIKASLHIPYTSDPTDGVLPILTVEEVVKSLADYENLDIEFEVKPLQGVGFKYYEPAGVYYPNRQGYIYAVEKEDRHTIGLQNSIYIEKKDLSSLSKLDPEAEYGKINYTKSIFSEVSRKFVFIVVKQVIDLNITRDLFGDKRKRTDNKEKCVICGKEIIGYGNNAQPLKEGRCCDECNNKVILERLVKLYY